MPEGPAKALYEWFERRKAQVRAIVEHPFHIIKNLFGYRIGVILAAWSRETQVQADDEARQRLTAWLQTPGQQPSLMSATALLLFQPDAAAHRLQLRNNGVGLTTIVAFPAAAPKHNMNLRS